MPDFAGKAAVVTGSSSGIGLAIATALAQQGCAIAFNGLGDPAALTALAASVAADHGVKTIAVPADMSKPEEVRGLVQQAEAAFGKVDILINNAGIQNVAPIEEFPEAKWDLILAITLSGAFHAMKAVVPGMKARGHGRIVTIASAHSVIASPFKSAYVAAKHGVLGLSKTVALEVATSGITVNCISPGYVWTPLVEAQIPGQMAARNMTREQVIHDVLLEAQPTKKFVTVEEIAAAALYLCSDAAASINGTNLLIDGGWTAK
jgi:3-hydroxybutyrate dehydrogenase